MYKGASDLLSSSVIDSANFSQKVETTNTTQQPSSYELSIQAK